LEFIAAPTKNRGFAVSELGQGTVGPLAMKIMSPSACDLVGLCEDRFLKEYVEVGISGTTIGGPKGDVM